MVLVAGACGQQRDPTSFSPTVGKNFAAGCAKAFIPKGDSTDPRAAQHKSFCTCLYKELSNPKTGIGFKAFSEAQNKIRTDPYDPANAINKLIPNYDAYVAKCPGGATQGPSVN